MKALTLTEMYIENLKKWNRPESYIYCIRLLGECIKDVFPEADASSLSGEFFSYFFMEWLPYNVCQEDDEIINMVYSRIKDLCKFCDRKRGTKLCTAFMSLEPFMVSEAKRVMYVKKHIMQFIKSPVINKRPEVIDLEKYRLKKISVPKNQQGLLPEEGYFKVADIFTNNSVVLKKISGYTFFIRVYFNELVINKIRPGDMLDMKVRYVDGVTGWRVEDISGCIARDSI